MRMTTSLSILKSHYRGDHSEGFTDKGELIILRTGRITYLGSEWPRLFVKLNPLISKVKVKVLVKTFLSEQRAKGRIFVIF